eukprot:CAMPEP_0197877892 /NCGR_PEP_ID=MMETSP1439-20131203/6446_1 /TAXON_ID=66791 /ORGANISM="Gonyaulax spinifera, Strain CCMP409" /LENGTH=226 /DNA_ID=CAMNT_0043497271 /DNA_START=91 /DNA_END=768 /DNA_ORIENTATION=-
MASDDESETLHISDGTTMRLTRLPSIDDATWGEMQRYLEGNPHTAKALQRLSSSPEAMRGWLQTQAIAEHYNSRLSQGDKLLEERIRGLEQDPELGPVLEEVKKHGLDMAMRLYHDEELMIKFSRKMGGIPEELRPTLQTIDETPMSLQEAAKNGDVKAVEAFLSKRKPLDGQDSKGITALGYAIGANKVAVAKLLLQNRANLHAVDAAGNGGLHYAAGYGRMELL